MMKARRFTVWGARADYARGNPIRLTTGTVAECRAECEFRRAHGGWTLITTPEGARPSDAWVAYATSQVA
jgi:hypothetical protein